MTLADGFRLLRKPFIGDLLGTTINTIAPPFAEVDHVWAATDLGPSTAGFHNNSAVGFLALTPGAREADFPPLFFFVGNVGSFPQDEGIYYNVARGFRFFGHRCDLDN